MNTPSTVIKIFGLGGGGSNAVNRMIDIGLEGVEYIAANTDAQALKLSQATTKLQIGPKLTKGLGAGGRWEVGREAALESRNEIRKALDGADVVFLTCGMGGGTGTGAISVAAEIARGMGILTVAIVTTPFSFEASRRRANSEAGLEALRPTVDTLIQVSNDKLLGLVGRNVPFETALRVADEVLRQGVQGLTEMITRPGLINVDFNNVRAIMQDAGNAMMAIGQGKGENKAADAIHQALHMPLLDLPTLQDARGVLLHFTGGDDLSLFEVSQAGEQIRKAAPDADIVFGASMDPAMQGRAQVILIATGFTQRAPEPRPLPVIAAQPIEQPSETESAPAHESVAAAKPAPRVNLAQALFSQAMSPEPKAESFVAQEVTVNPNNLDIPAFLRRRRSIGDLKG
ncbi:MAG: cell division protein FtsZ [Anaerolineales bacterium]|nr:cell division protein FtsZ [Anaerolineales bacterium]